MTITETLVASLVGLTARESVGYLIEAMKRHPEARPVLEPKLQKAVKACCDGHPTVMWEAGE